MQPLNCLWRLIDLRCVCVKRQPLILRGVILSLILCVLLIDAPAASGRWDIPQTVKSATRSRSVSGKAAVATAQPSPTPLPLPDQVRAPILMYHYVSDLPPDADHYRRDLTVTPDQFAAQMDYLVEAGYHTVTLTDLYLHLTESYPLPEKPIVLTFDDGYRDAYEVVFPMLLDRGLTGTFFVLATPAHFESPGYLTWRQMQEMSDAGMEIQSHGREHVDLRGRSYDYLIYQIVGIQEAIQHHTGRLPRFYCYPGGQYDANVIAVLESTGYWGAVTTAWGDTHTRDGLFEMARVRVRGEAALESFIRLLPANSDS